MLCEGSVGADRERIWAWHQTLTDPGHLEAARVLRRARVGALRPVREAEVELRALGDYDTSRSASTPASTPASAQKVSSPHDRQMHPAHQGTWPPKSSS